MHFNAKFGEVFGLSKDLFVITHSADCDPIARTCCLVHKHPQTDQYTSACVFGSFDSDRISNIEDLEEFAPPDDSDGIELSKEQKAACWDDHLTELLSRLSRYLSPDACGWCFRHQGPCKVVQTIQESNKNKGKQDVVLVNVCQDSRGELDLTVQNAQPASKHGKEKAVIDVDEDGDQTPEVMMITGGTECVDFAGYGGREGEGGKSRRAFNAFIGDIFANQPLWVMTEISGTKDLVYYTSRLQAFYDCRGLSINTNGMGGGGRRTKMYMFATNLFKGKQHGSVGAFVELYQCCPQLEGVHYYTSPAAERYRVAAMRASVHGHHVPKYDESKAFSIPLSLQCTSLQYERLTHGKKEMNIKAAEDPTVISDNESESKLQTTCSGWHVDLAQIFGYSRSGPVLMPLVTHASVVNAMNDDILLPLETLLVQGENVSLPEGSLPPMYDFCPKKVFRKLDKTLAGQRALVRLAGNSQTVYVAALWQLYWISETEVHCLELRRFGKVPFV